jgi:hypothetical protein
MPGDDELQPQPARDPRWQVGDMIYRPRADRGAVHVVARLDRDRYAPGDTTLWAYTGCGQQVVSGWASADGVALSRGCTKCEDRRQR